VKRETLEQAMRNFSEAGDAQLRKLYAKKKQAEEKSEEPLPDEDLQLLEQTLKG
jgi:hypothetical protein